MIHPENFHSGKSISHPLAHPCFLTADISRKWKWEDQTIKLSMEKTGIQYIDLRFKIQFVSTIDLMIHLTKKTMISIGIECSQDQMGEVLMFQKDIIPGSGDQ